MFGKWFGAVFGKWFGYATPATVQISRVPQVWVLTETQELYIITPDTELWVYTKR